MDEDNRLILRCQCGELTHVLGCYEIHIDEINDYGFSVEMVNDREWSFRNRVIQAIKVLRNHPEPTSEIILSRESAKQLVEFFIERTER